MVSWAARKLAVKAFFKKIGLAIAGIPGLFLSLLADKAIQAFLKWLDNYYKQLKEDKKNKELLEKDLENQKALEKVLESNTKTKEDIKDATSNFLNGR